jgi:hypothetical protein
MSLVVDNFRALAKLHLASPDDALVRFAHGDGYDRPGAQLVRTAFAASGMTLPGIPSAGAVSLAAATAASQGCDPPAEPRGGCEHDSRVSARGGGYACTDCGEWFPETTTDCHLESFVVEEIIHSPLLEDVEEFSVSERLGFRPVASEECDEESILY